MACLDEQTWTVVRQRTTDWVAKAISYVDTVRATALCIGAFHNNVGGQAWVSREDILECFATHWRDGKAEMQEVAYHHYAVPRDIQSQSIEKVELDGDVKNQLEQINKGKLLAWYTSMSAEHV